MLDQKVQALAENPMCEIELVGRDGVPVKHHMLLEVATNFLVDKTHGAESAILCRHTVFAGAQYETTLRGMIFRVRLHNDQCD